MIHVGDITLPDDRIVHGKIVSSYDRGTGAVDVTHMTFEWLDGDALTDDEYNEDLGGVYLHDYVTDALLLLPGEYDDEP